jgi:CRP/FNR family nitrogen fixation transcriptional regulator
MHSQTITAQAAQVDLPRAMVPPSDQLNLAGDVFGLYPGTSHRLTAEAVTDTTVRLVKRRSLEAAAGSNIRIAHNLWTMTAHELRHAEDHMLLLGRKTAMEKVATFLLEMDPRLAKAGMMALPMCRRDIGDYLGLTLETVSRALSQLNDQDILVFSSARQIVLRNRQRLADLAEADSPPPIGPLDNAHCRKMGDPK